MFYHVGRISIRDLCMRIHVPLKSTVLRRGYNSQWEGEISTALNLIVLHQVVGGGIRVVVTSDRRLVNTRMMSQVPWIWLSSKNPKAQVAQILSYFQLKCDPSLYMTRCVECNTGGFVLRTKEDVAGRVPKGVQKFYDEFWECPGCQKVFDEDSLMIVLTIFWM